MGISRISVVTRVHMLEEDGHERISVGPYLTIVAIEKIKALVSHRVICGPATV